VTVTHEIAVIGAGPGGYVAAIRAAQRGASVALIEKDAMGGTCLNRGCIPSKTLITTARLYRQMRDAHRWGFSSSGISFKWESIIARKDKVVSQLSRGIEYLLKKNKVTIYRGTARLDGAKRVLIESPLGNEAIGADRIILATGSLPGEIPLFPMNRRNIVTSDEALSWKELPDSLLIVGAGVIGCEFAMLFATFGVRVTLVEALPSVLAQSSLDHEISGKIEALMKRKGIDLKLSARIDSLVPGGGNGLVTAKLEGGEEIVSEKALICVGRRPATENLGLEEAGIEMNRKKEVIVDQNLLTNVPDIYAIGDMNGKWQLAHVASFQGIRAAEAATGEPAADEKTVVPWCIFTDPPAATVGLSEKEAAEKGIETTVGKFPYRALGKAVASGETEGMVKLVAEKEKGTLLGAHLLGEGSPEMVHELAMAIHAGMSARDVMHMIHAHPTYSESITEVCENIYGIGIHT